jgi:hypothetical protein
MLAANESGVRTGQDPAEAARLARRRMLGLAVLWTLVFVVFTMAVWRSRRVTDPLSGDYSDHLRYRYCASLVVRNPIRAMTTPLRQLAQEDNSRFPVVTWEEEPCHAAGVVHLAVHAPFQWVLERGWLNQWQVTDAYVTLLLALSAVTLFWVSVGQTGWAVILLAPLLIRGSLNGFQEVIPVLLSLIGFDQYRKGRRLVAVAAIVGAAHAYSRYVIWFPALAWLLWRDRRELRSAYEQRWKSWGFRVAALAVVLLAAWTCFSIPLISAHRPLSPWMNPGPLAWSVLIGYGLVCLIHIFLHRQGDVCPFLLAQVAFYLTYRGTFAYWYAFPALAVIALRHTHFESLMWCAWVLVVGRLFWGANPLKVMDLLRFAAQVGGTAGLGG